MFLIRSSSFLSSLLLLLAFGGVAGAQSLAVRSLAMQSGEHPEFFLKGAKGFLPLEFSNVQPTEVVPALPANPLPLYEKEVNDEGDEKFIVSRKVKVPSGARGVLLLSTRVGEKIRYVAIEDDFGSARFNDWLLINTSGKPIAFKVGQKSKPTVIKAGSSVTYRVSAEKGKGAAVIAQAPFGGKNKTFYSTYWPVYPGKRAVVLFADDGPKIRVKRISDKLAPVAKP